MAHHTLGSYPRKTVLSRCRLTINKMSFVSSLLASPFWSSEIKVVLNICWTNIVDYPAHRKAKPCGSHYIKLLQHCYCRASPKLPPRVPTNVISELPTFSSCKLSREHSRAASSRWDFHISSPMEMICNLDCNLSSWKWLECFLQYNFMWNIIASYLNGGAMA